MRTATTVVNRMPLLRAALLGSGLAAAWVVVSLVSGPSSASAEEDPSGLLGAVGSVVGVADGTVGAVDAAADEVVEPVATAVVAPVAETVGAVEQVAPAPIRPVVDAVPVMVDTTTDAASGTIDTVDSVTTDVVTHVGDVAGGAPVGGIADPLVDVVDDVVGSLPVLGPVLGDDTLGGLLGPVVGVVDDTLGSVVGDLGPLPEGGLLPSLPDLGGMPGEPGLEEPGGLVPAGGDEVAQEGTGASPGMQVDRALSGLRLGSPDDPGFAALPDAIAPWTGAPVGGSGAPLGTSAPAASSSAGGSGSGGAGSDAAFDAHDLDALASLVLHTVDDALPSSPVHDTDTTPD
jgi:hypothetical protein